MKKSRIAKHTTLEQTGYFNAYLFPPNYPLGQCLPLPIRDYRLQNIGFVVAVIRYLFR